MGLLARVIFLIFVSVSSLFAYGFGVQFKIPLKVGVVIYSEEFLPALKGLKDGLNNLGYVKEKSVYFNTKVIDGNLNKIEDILEEFHNEGIKVLFVTTTPVSRKIFSLNKKYGFQIIFNEVAAPVVSGLANSLENPGKNFTGVSHAAVRMIPKRIELATQFFFDSKTIYYLTGILDSKLKGYKEKLKEAANLLNVEIDEINFHEDKFDNFVKSLAVKDNSKSMIVLGLSPEIVKNFNKIRDISYMYNIPVIAMDSNLVELGAVFSYAPDFYLIGKQSAFILDMIFKGAKASDIPIQLPEDVYITINATALKYYRNYYDKYFFHLAKKVYR